MKKVKLLLVDDEKRICDNIIGGLKNLTDNYVIHAAYSAGEAIEVLEHNQFDVMVTDISMPNIDGLELLKISKNIQNDLQTIVLTGHGDFNNAIESLRLGAINYIKKPVSFEVLRYSIDEGAKKIDLIRQLRKSEERFRSSFNVAATGMVIVHPNGNITQVNESFCQMLLYSQDELINQKILNFLYADDIPIIEENLNTLILGKTNQFQFEIRFVKKDKSRIWTNISFSTMREKQVPVFFVGQILDITLKKQREEKLLYYSIHDKLTGLYNRTFFDEEIARLERGRQNIGSVVIADVDGLKIVNDTLGHAEGDKLLKEAAKLLHVSFRADDAVARIGGDEFAVLLPGADKSIAQQSIDRMNTGMKKIFIMSDDGKSKFPLSISFGISTWEKNCSLKESLKNADEQMYKNKNTQRK